MRVFSQSLLSPYTIKTAKLFSCSFLPLSSLPSYHSPSMTDLSTDISVKLRSSEEQRNSASERSWELNASLVRVEMTHDSFIKCPKDENALKIEEETLERLVKDTVLSAKYYNNIVHDTADEMKMEANEYRPHPRAPRLDNISYKMEDFARFKSLRHYLQNGSLISPTAFTITDGKVERRAVTDEEYIAGACIGLCHDLVNFGITRASNAGIDSTVGAEIHKARDIVASIFEELLQFDFRNSPLRRKYDSTKYALKSLETLLYELTVAEVLGGRETKKAKLGEKEEMLSQDIIPKEEIAAIRVRMDHRDKLRERLIKSCRDGQKAGKQAIFALHRGDKEKALKLLNDCENCVLNDLMPILQEEPDLRGGSFSGVLEEYVEAYLFYYWLQTDDEGNNNEPCGKILNPDSLRLKVSTEEYLGGLCDLSGEITRFAIARGTKRDKKCVQLCLETNKRIYNTLRMIGKVPSFLGKKKNALKMSVEKLERVQYELCLMDMTGRNQYSTSLENNSQIDED